MLMGMPTDAREEAAQALTDLAQLHTNTIATPDKQQFNIPTQEQPINNNIQPPQSPKILETQLSSVFNTQTPAPAQAITPETIMNSNDMEDIVLTSNTASVVAVNHNEVPVVISQPIVEPVSVVQNVVPTNIDTNIEPVSNINNSAITADDDAALVQEQLKFCLTLLRHLKKRKDAFAFLAPVDPVLLNIPTYFDVIEKPMDISTVEKKLVASVYKNASEFINDMKLIFDNCYKFNGLEAAVSLLGKSLEKHFFKEIEKLPKELKEKKKKPARNSITPLSATGPDGIPRPKREVPTLAKDIQLETFSRLPRKLTPQLKFASSLLRDLMKKHYAPYNLAFLQPVDPEALGIPQYRDIIKNPMDLLTIRKKLDAGQYDDGDAFESDIRLMFQNCYTFNAPGTEVYNLGKELEAVYDRKWADRPPPGDYEEKPRRISQPSAYDMDDADDSSDDDDADAQHIEMLKTQVQLLTTQLTLLTEKRAKKKKMKAMGSANKLKRARPNRPKPTMSSTPFPKQSMKQSSAVSNKLPLSEAAIERVEELTYDQKRELSENINILTQDQLTRVLQIIKENTHIDESQGEEIELDIDSLDKKTLWKLYTYVAKHTRKTKRAKTEGPGFGNALDSSSSGTSSGSDSDDSGTLLACPESFKDLHNHQHSIIINSSDFPQDYIRCIHHHTASDILAMLSNDNKLWIWDVKTWKCINTRTIIKRANSILFTNDGKSILIGDKFGDVYKCSTNDMTLDLNLLLGHVSMITDMLLSFDEQYLLTSDRDEKIRVSKYPNCYEIAEFCLGHLECVTSMHMIPTKCMDVLVSGGGDDFLCVWNFKLGELLYKEKLNDVIQGKLAVSRIISFGENMALFLEGEQMVRMFEIKQSQESGIKLEFVQNLQMQSTVMDIAFNGGYLVIACENGCYEFKNSEICELEWKVECKQTWEFERKRDYKKMNEDEREQKLNIKMENKRKRDLLKQ